MPEVNGVFSHPQVSTGPGEKANTANAAECQQFCEARDTQYCEFFYADNYAPICTAWLFGGQITMTTGDLNVLRTIFPNMRWWTGSCQ